MAMYQLYNIVIVTIVVEKPMSMVWQEDGVNMIYSIMPLKHRYICA